MASRSTKTQRTLFTVPWSNLMRFRNFKRCPDSMSSLRTDSSSLNANKFLPAHAHMSVQGRDTIVTTYYEPVTAVCIFSEVCFVLRQGIPQSSSHLATSCLLHFSTSLTLKLAMPSSHLEQPQFLPRCLSRNSYSCTSW